MKVLHIGAGRKGRVLPDWMKVPPHTSLDIISLDQDVRLHPDITCQLGAEAIPLPTDSIDIIVANHVLEHIGKQGETDEWFAAFEECYRILKPSGKLCFESPMWNSVWAWGDPSHTRALSPEAFYFFQQDNYRITGEEMFRFEIHPIPPAILDPFVGEIDEFRRGPERCSRFKQMNPSRCFEG